MSAAPFSDEQIRRYSRQILLREVGGRGQTRLLSARPVLLCVDEVGQIAAAYLWRAGVTAPSLFATTPERALTLHQALAATGYAGTPAQPVSAAPPTLQAFARAAPGFTALWWDSPEALTDPLWACCQGSYGAVGEGAQGLHAAVRHAATPTTTTNPGAAAMIIGSALALLTLQRLLSTGPPPDRAELWQLDLASPTLPTWSPPSR